MWHISLKKDKEFISKKWILPASPRLTPPSCTGYKWGFFCGRCGIGAPECPSWGGCGCICWDRVWARTGTRQGVSVQKNNTSRYNNLNQILVILNHHWCIQNYNRKFIKLCKKRTGHESQWVYLKIISYFAAYHNIQCIFLII